MWIFGFSLGVCSTELCNLVSSLEYLVSNGRQVLLGDIRLVGSAIVVLQAGGACYSWRLPPPRWLGGGLRRGPQEAYVVLRRRAL